MNASDLNMVLVCDRLKLGFLYAELGELDVD